MIEEEAVVAEVEAGRVWVEKVRKSACGSCQQSCTSAVVGDFMGESTVRLPVISCIDVAPGDRVLIGVREDALLKGSLAVYLLPLVGLFAGAILGKAMGSFFFSVTSDFAAIIGGLLGLIGTIAFLKFAMGISQDKLQPVVLRKLS
jgi:sigma-E factor negative regulatory protein RseC